MSCTDGLVNMDFDGSLANKIDYQIVTFVHEKTVKKNPQIRFQGYLFLNGNAFISSVLITTNWS